ncbi:glutamyl aminopeptidase, partial [Brachionus plicatilis]
YLEANSWGTGSSQLFFSQLGKIGPWQATDFADRWFRQPNYPVLEISILNSSNQNFYLNVQQSRFINTNDSVFGSESIYPSPYNWTWYIPLNCIFFVNGSSIHQQKFYIGTQKYSELIDDGKTEYDFFHCDINFSGYFSLNYPHENWIAISEALNDQESVFIPVDRSNIIHNLFMNAFTSRLPYKELTQTLIYLIAEREYLPWKTVNFHLSQMISILEYKEPFFEVASYFDYFLRTIENEVDLWNPGGNHVEELYKETILKTACLLQDSFCLKNASFLWEKYRPYLTDTMVNNTFPSYVKKLVFNYHLQNTYFAEDWNLVYSEYSKIDDLSEREKLLEALTYTRLPWFLEIYLQRLEDDLINFFDKIKFLSKNCLGREYAWNYIRANYDNLLEEFGLDDPRLGQMVIDVSSTFETESLNYELLNFITSTPNGASLNARYRALEKVSINLLWLRKKSQEIMEAFGSPRKNIFI